MEFTQLDEAEIFAIIHAEISQSKLDSVCHAEAEKESNGNYDLMISRYFSKRSQILRDRHMANNDDAKALDKRNRSANESLIRYKADTKHVETREDKERFSALSNMILGNIILLLSSVSAISALKVIKGYTIHSFSYLFIFGAVVISLGLPYFCSNVVFKKYAIRYETCLLIFCVIMCLGSVSFGVLLMKEDPQNYEADQKTSTVVEPQSEVDQIQLDIEPASDEEAPLNIGQ